MTKFRIFRVQCNAHYITIPIDHLSISNKICEKAVADGVIAKCRLWFISNDHWLCVGNASMAIGRQVMRLGDSLESECVLARLFSKCSSILMNRLRQNIFYPEQNEIYINRHRRRIDCSLMRSSLMENRCRKLLLNSYSDDSEVECIRFVYELWRSVQCRSNRHNFQNKCVCSCALYLDWRMSVWLALVRLCQVKEYIRLTRMPSSVNRIQCLVGETVRRQLFAVAFISKMKWANVFLEFTNWEFKFQNDERNATTGVKILIYYVATYWWLQHFC